MLPLKKFLRYDDFGNGTVAVFETGITEFIDLIDQSGTVPCGVDANQVVSRSDLERWIYDAEQRGSDASSQRRVLAEWPVNNSPVNGQAW